MPYHQATPRQGRTLLAIGIFGDVWKPLDGVVEAVVQDSLVCGVLMLLLGEVEFVQNLSGPVVWKLQIAVLRLRALVPNLCA